MQRQVESGVQLFSRINHSGSTFCLNDLNPKLFQKGEPVSSEIIEVAGDFTKELLIDFMVRCVLPKELHLNWKGSGVVFINTTHQINIITITEVIDKYLKHLNIVPTRPIIEKAISQITFLNCYSSEEIEMTFFNLKNVIEDRDNVRMLIVDDITSQFWVAKQNNSKLSYDQFAKQNFQLLLNVKNLNLIIFSRYQLGDPKKPVDSHVSYKIITEKEFLILDYGKKTSSTVPFTLEKFITFL